MGFACCTLSSRRTWLLGGLLLAATAGAVIAVVVLLRKPEAKIDRTMDAPAPTVREDVPVPAVRFTDVTAPAGITFHHDNGLSGKKLLPETMGAGVAVIDFDGDGLPDLLFVNSCPWPGQEKSSVKAPTLTLYRNLGKGKFEDVTAAAGLAITMYGMGATVGDYDNDGLPDLFVTGVGGNRLFHHEWSASGANGHLFREVTPDAHVGGPGGWPQKLQSPEDFFQWDKPICFSSSAAFLDYDGDGRLDLFVCNYVTWAPKIDLAIDLNLDGSERRFGQPTLFTGAKCILYHNEGGGQFKDVSATSGVEVVEREGIGEDAPLRPVGKSLGVIVCDADEDGWPDVIVANDTVRNFFFHNQKGPDAQRVFKELGREVGVAYAQGKARGAMGIDWAPRYRPRCDALLITNFADEPDTFLCQDRKKPLQFRDRSISEGIAGPSQLPLKFGAFFFDYDLDGRLDFLTSNGHLDPDIGSIQAGQTYAQPPQLFWNAGTGEGRGFEPVTPEAAGPDLFAPMVGRGGAYFDMDGDGDLDVVLTANGGPARLLRNESRLGHHWLRLRLEGDGVHSNRSAIGARVILEAGGAEQHREVAAARGYLSQSELVVTFGLGKLTQVDRITIHWPGREAGPPTVIEKGDVKIDQEMHVRQGAKK
jgi:hypothetical protein